MARIDSISEAKSGGISGFILSPAIKEFKTFYPNKVYKGEFEITNNLNTPVKIEFELFDIDQDKIGAPLLTPNGNPNFSIKNWIKLCCDKVILKPGQKKIISYEIIVPKDELPGGKYGAIVAKVKNNAGLKNVALSAGIGHIIIGKSYKTSFMDSKIVKFNVVNKYNFNWPFKSTKFVLKIRNLGNIHERITGALFIYKDSPTETIKVISVNPNKTLVLPKHEREYVYEYSSPPVIEVKNGTFKFNLNALSIGRYHALLRVKHYEKNKLITEERIVSFWLLPWWLIFIILALIIIIGKIIYGLRKQRT